MMKLLNKTAFVFVIVLLVFSDLFSQQPNRYKITVQYANSLMASTDAFEFSAGAGNKIIINKTNLTATFPRDFAPGETYSVSQTSGPRTCAIEGERQGTITNRDVVLSVNCGFPPMVRFKLNVTGVEQGETFNFADSYNRTLSTAFSVLANLGGFPIGDSYSISQTGGPRPCKLTRNQGVVPNTDLIVEADCKKTAGPTTGFAVTGVLTAKPGTTVLLKERNNQEISVTAKPDDGKLFTETSFVFPKEIEDSAIYSVSIKTAPAGQNCAVTKNGEGMIGGSSPVVYVVCDVAWDLVSRGTDDKTTGTFYDSTAPVIGGKGGDDGRYVAFVSYAAGLGGSTGRKRQIFWRDRHTGVTRMISVGANGEEGNGDSFAPAISADGRSVAFESYATNLVPIDTNKVRDVFVWNADTNTVTAVSDAPGGIEANAEAFEPTISGDGKLIAFTSSASNLTREVDGTSQTNVFLKDMQTGTVTLISRDEKTKKAGGGSRPSISEDGSRIAFYNYFPLIAADTNNLWDIYVWERGNPKLKRISLTSERGERNQGDESASRIVAPAISGNGKFVTFSTTAGNVVSNDNNKLQDVFIVDVDTLRVSRLSLNNNAEEGNGDSPIGQGEKIGITYDAKWVVFSTNAKNLGGNIIMKNFVTGEARVISAAQGASVGRPEISREGGFVVFGTSQKLDPRFQSSGIFVTFTGATR